MNVGGAGRDESGRREEEVNVGGAGRDESRGRRKR